MSDFFSIALLKPDISSGFYSFSNCQDTRSSDDATKMFPNGQIVTEIIKRIQKEGMRVQQRKMIHLTKVQARRILRWQQQEESTLYETKLDLITRGPSLALLVTSTKPNENPVDKLKSLVGNSNFDPASIREQFKESPIEEWPLRALCGLDFARDGVYVSQTIDCAFRERYMLFPPAKAQLERAIVGLKPNFISNFSNARELVSNLFDYEGVMILETVEKILQNPKEMRAINEFDGLVGFEDYTSNLEALLRTGRSVVMLVEGLDLTYRLRELVGPLDVVEAKKYFPESLRALYGEEQTLERNGVFVCLNNPRRVEEMRQLWFSTPEPIERTLAIIKPCTASNLASVAEIQQTIQNFGFEIEFQRRLKLTREQSIEFYREHKGKESFERLTNFMTTGDIVVMQLSRKRAVVTFRRLMGPTNSLKAKETHPWTLRGRYGTDATENATHGSDSPLSASRELGLFFPKIGASSSNFQGSIKVSLTRDFVLKSLPSPFCSSDTIEKILIESLAELMEEKPEDRLEAIAWLGHRLLAKSPAANEKKANSFASSATGDGSIISPSPDQKTRKNIQKDPTSKIPAEFLPIGGNERFVVIIEKCKQQIDWAAVAKYYGFQLFSFSDAIKRCIAKENNRKGLVTERHRTNSKLSESFVLDLIQENLVLGKVLVTDLPFHEVSPGAFEARFGKVDLLLSIQNNTSTTTVDNISWKAWFSQRGLYKSISVSSSNVLQYLVRILGPKVALVVGVKKSQLLREVKSIAESKGFTWITEVPQNWYKFLATCPRNVILTHIPELKFVPSTIVYLESTSQDEALDTHSKNSSINTVIYSGPSSHSALVGALSNKRVILVVGHVDSLNKKNLHSALRSFGFTVLDFRRPGETKSSKWQQGEEKEKASEVVAGLKRTLAPRVLVLGLPESPVVVEAIEQTFGDSFDRLVLLKKRQVKPTHIKFKNEEEEDVYSDDEEVNAKEATKLKMQEEAAFAAANPRLKQLMDYMSQPSKKQKLVTLEFLHEHEVYDTINTLAQPHFIAIVGNALTNYEQLVCAASANYNAGVLNLSNFARVRDPTQAKNEELSSVIEGAVKQISESANNFYFIDGFPRTKVTENVVPVAPYVSEQLWEFEKCIAPIEKLLYLKASSAFLHAKKSATLTRNAIEDAEDQFQAHTTDLLTLWSSFPQVSNAAFIRELKEINYESNDEASQFHQVVEKWLKKWL